MRKSFKNGCQQIHIYFANKDFPQHFFLFDFSQISCEAITTFNQFSLCIRIANARNLSKIERENLSKMDVNKSAFILPTKIFRSIFYFLIFLRFLAKQSRPSANWKYILPSVDSQMPFDTVGTYFMYVRPPNDIASQEINSKSNRKILKKWTSTNPHLFCQQRFSAEFFFFYFHIDFLRSNHNLRSIENIFSLQPIRKCHSTL